MAVACASTRVHISAPGGFAKQASASLARPADCAGGHVLTMAAPSMSCSCTPPASVRRPPSISAMKPPSCSGQSRYPLTAFWRCDAAGSQSHQCRQRPA